MTSPSDVPSSDRRSGDSSDRGRLDDGPVPARDERPMRDGAPVDDRVARADRGYAEESRPASDRDTAPDRTAGRVDADGRGTEAGSDAADARTAGARREGAESRAVAEDRARRRKVADQTEEVADTSRRSRTALLWVALILGAIVLIALLIFIIQNNVKAHFNYLSWGFDLPLGVAMLLAAIAGALVMALVGSVRMIQMSLQLRRLRKHVHRAIKEMR